MALLYWVCFSELCGRNSPSWETCQLKRYGMVVASMITNITWPHIWMLLYSTMYLKYTPKMILANIEAYNLGTWQGLCFGARFSGLSEKLQFGSIIAIMTRPHILEVDVISRQLLQIYLEITLGMIEADWGSWQ